MLYLLGELFISRWAEEESAHSADGQSADTVNDKLLHIHLLHIYFVSQTSRYAQKRRLQEPSHQAGDGLQRATSKLRRRFYCISRN